MTARDPDRQEREEYLRRASFCRAYAETLTDPGQKAAVLKMAEKWKRLADDIEARDRT
jgi:hypothetical protein